MFSRPPPIPGPPPLPFAGSSFQFLNHGPLVDREFELVPPDARWTDELLRSCRDPLTTQLAPADGNVSRQQVRDFLSRAPLGREPADPATGRVPAYHFWMLLRHGPEGPGDRPPLRIAGGCVLRIGSSESIERYYGHIGYHVYPPARGHSYAERACRLMLPLARAHGFRTLWITCNPENMASRRTCEKLGAVYIETIPIPETEPLFRRGEIAKCRYRLAV